MHRERLIIFTRYPESGRVKTRLIPSLGAEGAAALHRRLTLRTLRAAEALRATRGVEIEVRFVGGSAAAMCHWLGDEKLFREQNGNDLGERMSRAFDDSFRDGAKAAVVVGSDCPLLSFAVLNNAFGALAANKSVLGPASDGGYYLIGLNQRVPEIFRGVVWGTSTVLNDTLGLLAKSNIQPVLLHPLADVDVPDDLPAFQKIIEAEESDLRRVSVIIPALNESEHIAATVEAALRSGARVSPARSQTNQEHAGETPVPQFPPHEILVVDGGSRDGTGEKAREAGATVIQSAPGRARQLNAGAARATGNILLFLHADTLLPDGYIGAISQALQPNGAVAGAFRFRIKENFSGKWLTEWTANWRSRFGQMPYGDQALFLRRSLFEEMGGFADLPVMEDYEFVRRLRRRGRIVTLKQFVLTSGRRWQRLGFWRATVINKRMVMAYRLGWPMERLVRIYRAR